jgi:DNA-binding CsgD family transcriptional regulator
MFLVDVPELTKIRIIVSHGSILEVEEALRVLSEVETFLNEVHNEYHTIDIELLKSMAQHRLGNHEQAQNYLGKALLVAEKKELKRPILEAYQVMPALFRQADLPAKSLRILVRLGLDISPAKTPFTSTLSKQQLTLREQEIVAHIANGLRNKEIAKELNISTVTVKSHLTNIYKKLNVPNRTSMLRVIQHKTALA